MEYYKIFNVDCRVTDPEQWVAVDVPRFCSELSDLVQEDLAAVIDGALVLMRAQNIFYGFWLMSWEQGL